MKKNLPTCKIIALGSSNVGKSSILKAYTNNEFDISIRNTVGIDSINAEFKFNDNSSHNLSHNSYDNSIHLQILDTAGQERFSSIIKSYYKNVDAFLFIYDVTDLSSFEYLKEKIKEIEKSNKTLKKTVKNAVLIGNKADLISDYKSETKKMKEFVEIFKNFEFDFYLTSAKTGMNINVLFRNLILKREKGRMIVRKRKWC